MQLSAQFKLEKETKGTFRYAEKRRGSHRRSAPIRPEVGASPSLPPPASPSLSKHWTDPRCLGTLSSATDIVEGNGGSKLLGVTSIMAVFLDHIQLLEWGL